MQCTQWPGQRTVEDPITASQVIEDFSQDSNGSLGYGHLKVTCSPCSDWQERPDLSQGKRVKVTGSMEPHRQDGNHFVVYKIDEIRTDAEYDAHLLMVGDRVASAVF